MAYQFLILDSQGNAIAHGTSRHGLEGERWKLVIDDGDIQEVLKHSVLRLVCNSDAVPAVEGRLESWHGNKIVLKPMRHLEESLRENLRIPVRFTTYIYPKSGSWKGREPVMSEDLSCGGLAFRCQRQLEAGERVQIVIPITSPPLLLDLEVLRCKSRPEGEAPLYAGRFVDQIREQENMVREAVFGLQLREGGTVEYGDL